MDIGNIIGANWALFGLLFAACCAYNVLIGWLEEEGYIEGYVSLTVVGGTVITLATVFIIDWQAAVLCGIAFMFSGPPMIIGSVTRHARRRKREQRGVSRDQAPPLAE